MGRTTARKTSSPASSTTTTPTQTTRTLRRRTRQTVHIETHVEEEEEHYDPEHDDLVLVSRKRKPEAQAQIVPPVAAAAAAAAAPRPEKNWAIRKRNRRHSDDDDDDEREGQGIAARLLSRRFKTDPNERGVGGNNNNDNNNGRTNEEDMKLPPPFPPFPDAIDILDDDDDEIKVMQTVPSTAARAAANPPSLLQQVLEVFPDADPAHVQTLLPTASSESKEVQLQRILHQMMEKDYPRVAKTPLEPKEAAAGAGAAGGVELVGGTMLVHMQPKKNSWKYDFLSTSSSFEITPQYRNEALDDLVLKFPFLSMAGATQLLHAAKFHYAICHERIIDALKGPASATDPDAEATQLRNLQVALNSKRISQDQRARLEALVPRTKVTVKRPRPRKADEQDVKPIDPIFAKELLFVQERLSAWISVAVTNQRRKRNKEESQKTGTGISCACCFDDFCIDDAVQCREEGHLFCPECLKQFAESQIFGSNSLGVDPQTKEPLNELRCFHGDGCTSGFSRAVLSKALPESTLTQYDALQSQIALQSANLSDLVTCPKCDFSAALSPDQRVFECPVAECRFASCRDCGEAAHVPLRCDEVEKEQETKGRLTVEEAITEAKIRRCPNTRCQKPLIKESGCNKIKCCCGTFMCYICKAQIKGYEHFCQTPHCTHESCNKCALWTKAEEDDAKAMREAGLQAADRVKRETAAQAAAAAAASSKNGTGIEVDVDGILRAP